MNYNEELEEKGHGAVGIVEAVETLTSIADLQIDGPIAIAQKHEMELQELPIIYRTVHWLHRRNAERVLHVVRDTYKTILNYLRHFYKKEHGKLIAHESVEGIKTIMVLVGEAAKKVDKYSRLFAGATSQSVKETQEFRDLWAFYQRKIAPIAVQESLAKWMHSLPLKTVVEPIATTGALPKATEHVFIDLDSVKRDSEYELFMIRKQDGSRFFSPRLLRNIKLVCNFEQYAGEEELQQDSWQDPWQELQVWKDHSAQLLARNILRQNWHVIDQFVKACHKNYNNDLAMILYRAVMALMLSANQMPVLKSLSKGSSGYFKDFQFFLRQALSNPDFHRLITYPPKDEESIGQKILFLSQELCKELFLGFHTSNDLAGLVNDLVAKGQYVMDTTNIGPEKLALGTKMSLDYDAIMTAMQHFGHAPLLQSIDMLQNSDISGFDTILQQNVPGCIFDLFPKGKRIAVLRLASPTKQEYIHKATVSDEFKTFIRALQQDPQNKMHLIINLQDRTGWKEFARCQALEEMQKNEEFSKALTVVSMTKDSDFYHQSGPYHDLNQADMFIEQLLEHVKSESSGFYFPPKVQKVLFNGFTKELATRIHELFFAGKNVLSRHSRMDFIEIFYLFVQLKIIECVEPTSLSFTCKDGLDVSVPASIELFIALKLINDRPLSEEEEEYMKLVLYSPCILNRGRSLFLDRFGRLNAMTKVIEAIIQERGEKPFHREVIEKLHPLFDHDILSSVISIPLHKWGQA